MNEATKKKNEPALAIIQIWGKLSTTTAASAATAAKCATTMHFNSF